MLPPEQLAEVVEQISKAQRYNRGAWQKVIDAGRAYAQMKAFGTYMKDGSIINVAHSARDSQEKNLGESLLRAAEIAFAEDAQLGVTVAEALG